MSFPGFAYFLKKYHNKCLVCIFASFLSQQKAFPLAVPRERAEWTRDASAVEECSARIQGALGSTSREEKGRGKKERGGRTGREGEEGDEERGGRKIGERESTRKGREEERRGNKRWEGEGKKGRREEGSEDTGGVQPAGASCSSEPQHAPL